ncbi:Nuclear pore complex protein NUP107 [Camellia lanceoleosa]|nr:Nuclear pore complex protein NUP107 [Camellia lanceoleosa]
MEVDMETSPSYFDPEDLSTRERYRRYGLGACWAMAKSWLDVQVDLELARLQPGGMDQFKTYEDAIDRILNQQPRHLSALLQKLHSSDSVHEAITQECKEQHQQIEILTCGTNEGCSFKEKIMTVGDLILHMVLSRSREIKPGKYDKSSDIAEQHRLQSLQKAMVIQWLCFTPPSTINDAQASSAKLLLRALLHRSCSYFHVEVPAMPIGAHTLLNFLLEPLKQPTETLLSTEDHDVYENLREFRTGYGKENPWLVPTEDHIYESVEPLFLELHAIAMLCLPSGECMCPDATLCATLIGAL